MPVSHTMTDNSNHFDAKGGFISGMGRFPFPHLTTNAPCQNKNKQHQDKADGRVSRDPAELLRSVLRSVVYTTRLVSVCMYTM